MLKDLLQECYEKVGKGTGALQRFVLLAKKANADITMSELKDIAQYTVTDIEGDFDSDEDRQKAIEKKQNNLNQQWRSHVILPTRSFVANKLYPDIDESKIFSKDATEEYLKFRNEIMDKLPRANRKSKVVKSTDHLSDIEL